MYTQPIYKCDACGELDDYSGFCIYCGFPLKEFKRQNKISDKKESKSE